MRIYSWRVTTVLIALVECFATASAVGATEWRMIELPSRPLNIVENHGTLWTCGADEMIARSTDGGKNWSTRHLGKGGAILLAVGFANAQFGYATGTGGTLLITQDGGEIWVLQRTGVGTIFAASFSDGQHGLIHTPSAVLYTADGGGSWNPVPLPPKGDERSPGFKFVFGLGVLDEKRMAVMFKDGGAEYNSQKLEITEDSGKTWKMVDIPSVTLYSFTTHGGEYWTMGTEVIEKDKPGGGYGVPVALHSKDGPTWAHADRPKEVPKACNAEGCLYRDGAGVQLYEQGLEKYWIFAAEKAVTPKWAVAGGAICSVGIDLRCASVQESLDLPPKEGRSGISPVMTPPALGAPAGSGLHCISCPIEHVLVTQDYQGIAEVELKITVALNGLVSDAVVVHATKPEIGARIAAAARSWIFEPFVKDGVAHPVVTTVKLKVQAIKSR
jgi:photosystem II stability/assembly factor-like uncharacterized protein